VFPQKKDVSKKGNQLEKKNSPCFFFRRYAPRRKKLTCVCVYVLFFMKPYHFTLLPHRTQVHPNHRNDVHDALVKEKDCPCITHGSAITLRDASCITLDWRQNNTIDVFCRSLVVFKGWGWGWGCRGCEHPHPRHQRTSNDYRTTHGV
jgi:hypothetical protein